MFFGAQKGKLLAAHQMKTCAPKGNIWQNPADLMNPELQAWDVFLARSLYHLWIFLFWAMYSFLARAPKLSWTPDSKPGIKIPFPKSAQMKLLGGGYLPPFCKCRKGCLPILLLAGSCLNWGLAVRFTPPLPCD